MGCCGATGVSFRRVGDLDFKCPTLTTPATLVTTPASVGPCLILARLVTLRADTHTPAGRQRAPCPTDRDRPIDLDFFLNCEARRQQFTPRRIRDDDRVLLHRTHRPRRGRTSTYEPAASVVTHVDSRERDRRPLFAWFRCDRRSSGERV